MRAPSLPSLLLSHWRLDAPVWIVVVAAVLLYVASTARVRGRWPLRRTLSFIAAAACLLVALQSGIDAFDDQLLSVHMVQHMLLLLAAPLLMLGGRPMILALQVLPPARRPRAARLISRLRPLTGAIQCLVIFWALVLGTHLPVFYEATLTHSSLHDGEHALFLLAGLMLWWPLLDGDPGRAWRLTGLGRLGYVLAAMVPMAIIGAYLNRHSTIVYPGYVEPARALHVSAISDQAQAGAIMWVVGNTFMMTVGLWATLAALVAEERRQQAREMRLRATQGVAQSTAPGVRR